MLNKVIEELYNEGTVREIIENIGVKGTDADDLEQEVYGILLEYDPDRIVEMHSKGQLRYFVVGIIQRQYNSKTSPFYKLYKKYYSIVDGNVVNNDEINDDDYNYQFED